LLTIITVSQALQRDEGLNYFRGLSPYFSR